MGFLSKILGSAALGMIPVIGPMLAMKNLMQPSAPSAPTSTTPPNMFGQSQFSQPTPPPMSMPPADVYGSGTADYSAPPTQTTVPPALNPQELAAMQSIRG